MAPNDWPQLGLEHVQVIVLVLGLPLREPVQDDAPLGQRGPAHQLAAALDSVLLCDVGIGPVPVPFVLPVAPGPFSEVLLIGEDHEVREVLVLVKDPLAEVAAARRVCLRRLPCPAQHLPVCLKY